VRQEASKPRRSRKVRRSSSTSTTTRRLPPAPTASSRWARPQARAPARCRSPKNTLVRLNPSSTTDTGIVTQATGHLQVVGEETATGVGAVAYREYDIYHPHRRGRSLAKRAIQRTLCPRVQYRLPRLWPSLCNLFDQSLKHHHQRHDDSN
jgi:hypothetical protein